MTQNKWVQENQNYYNWYYENYTFLQQFQLPIDHEILIEYYFADMENRNFTPSVNFANEYENVFSYFLDNFPKDENEKFSGKTDLQYIIDSIPDAINDVIVKPVSELGTIGKDFFQNINKYFPFLIGIGILYLSTKLLK
jgi:hypothetical protein